MSILWNLLKNKYPHGEYALLREVRNAAGYNASRSADGIVIGLWPSRGCLIEGIEIKSGRGDWLNELKQVEKAEAIFKYCDRWWIVANSEGIVKLEEVPAPWGFMEVVKDKLKVRKPAPELKPEPLSKQFVVAMIKRANSQIDSMITRESISQELAKATEEGKKDSKWTIDNLERRLLDLRTEINEFEKKSGITLNLWAAGRIGEAVKIILNLHNTDFQKQLEGLEDQAKRIHEAISTVLKAKQ